jgi:hypothetical protein
MFHPTFTCSCSPNNALPLATTWLLYTKIQIWYNLRVRTSKIYFWLILPVTEIVWLLLDSSQSQNTVVILDVYCMKYINIKCNVYLYGHCFLFLTKLTFNVRFCFFTYMHLFMLLVSALNAFVSQVALWTTPSPPPPRLPHSPLQVRYLVVYLDNHLVQFHTVQHMKSC